MKKILTLSLIACLALTATACKEETVKTATLNGFESYDEIRLIKPENCVGQTSLNTDKNYVTEGSGSLKFHIDRTSAVAAAHWQVSSAQTGETGAQDVNAFIRFLPKTEYAQLNKVDEFQVDIYNANAYDTRLVFFASDVNESVTFYCVRNLKAGQMNEISVPLNGLFYENSTANVAYYNLAFIGTGVDETYYVDDFKAVLGSGGKKAELQTAADWEILSFDSADEYNWLNPVSYTEMPSVRAYYNANAAFSRTGGSLCLEMLPYNGTEEKRSSATQSATAMGGGVSVHTGVISEKIAEADALLLEAYLDDTATKTLNVTVSDGKNTETQRFELVGGKWTTVKFESETVSLSEMTQLVVTVDTTENKNVTKIYLDDLRYE